MANILIGYDKIDSDKTGTLKHFTKLYLLNDVLTQTERTVAYKVTEVFLEGQVVGDKLVTMGNVEVNGDIVIGSYCKVLKESINGRDEVSYIGFSPRKK